MILATIVLVAAELQRNIMKIKINDIAFLGDKSSSKYHNIDEFEWYRGPNPTSDDNHIVFYTDMCLPLVEHSKNTYNVAWLIEPKVILPTSYQYVMENYGRFNLILSHHLDFVKTLPNAQWYPNNMLWVAKEDFKIYQKSKGVSIIASGKNHTKGHQLRHDLIKCCNTMDIFGYGYNPIEHKISALRDYMFNVAIENCDTPCYYSEKLLDCFVTGTIPIYWGTDHVKQHFNPDGIYFCKNLNELIDTVQNIYNDPLTYYLSKINAINDNFRYGQRYTSPESYIFQNILKPLGLV